MRINQIAWFREMWPFEAGRAAVLGEYRALERSPRLLADIALRGGLFSSPPRTPGDVFGDGVNEGRRQLAVEIIALARVDHAMLWDLIEKRPAKAGA